MKKLKPCRLCKSEKLFEDSEQYGHLYGYGIGCLNMNCENKTVTIGYGLSAKEAKERAIKKWNRRNHNGWSNLLYKP